MGESETPRRLSGAKRLPAGPVRRLAVIATVDAFGSGAYLTLGVVFFTTQLGFSAADVGFGLSLAGLCAMLAGALLGSVADRFGARRTLALLNALLAGLFLLYPFIHSLGEFYLLVSATAAGQAGVNPVRSALTFALTAQEQRVRLQALQRSLFNLGFTAGSALSGLVLQIGNREAFVGLVCLNAFSYVLCAVVARSLPAPEIQQKSTPRVRIWQGMKDRPFLAVTALCGALAISESLLIIGMPLWIVALDAPHGVVAAAVVLNTTMVVLLQVRVSRDADGPGRAQRLIQRAVVALIAGMVLLAVTPIAGKVGSVLLLLSATGAITLCELWTSAGGWAVVFAHAPAQSQGLYHGIFGLGISAQSMMAPLLIGSVLIPLGSAGWLLLGALFLPLIALTGRILSFLAVQPVPVQEPQSSTADDSPHEKESEQVA